jgi:hypothetical protein
MNERRPMRSARKSEPRSALGFGHSPLGERTVKQQEMTKAAIRAHKCEQM